MTTQRTVLTVGAIAGGLATLASVVIIREVPRMAVTVGRNVSGYTPINTRVAVTPISTARADLLVAVVWLVAFAVWATVTGHLLHGHESSE